MIDEVEGTHISHGGYVSSLLAIGEGIPCCRRLRGSGLVASFSMGLRPRLPAAAACAARLEPPAGAGGRLNPVALQPHRWRLYYVLGYAMPSPRGVCLEHPCFTRYDAPRRMGRGRSLPRAPDKPSLRELRRCMPALRLCCQTTSPYASGHKPRAAIKAAAARCLPVRSGRTSCGTLPSRRRPSTRW